jgi:hypothetical protein
MRELWKALKEAWAAGLPGHRAVARPRTTVSATVIRADGTREELGVISVNGRPVRRR